MAKKKQREAIPGYLFITLVCWILGIGFVAYGRLDGVLLILVAVLLTVVLPPVRRTITTMVKGARAVKRKASPPNELVVKIVRLLEDWKPVKSFNDESPAEAAASEYLNHYFSNKVKFQQYHGEFRSDLDIEDVGIEIEVLWKTAELTRLRGQMILYCKYFNRVVALIFNYNNMDLNSFIRDMKALYPGKVAVIPK